MVSDALMLLSWLPLAAGVGFFIAGTFGLLRFPDLYARLHAVTKADTLGLGLVVLGLCLRAQQWQPVLSMLLTWLLVMASGATTCQLLARYQRHREGRDFLTRNRVREPAHDESREEGRVGD